jgi:putative hemolysin
MATPTVPPPSRSGRVKSFLPVRGVASRFLPWKQLDELVARSAFAGQQNIFSSLLQALNVHCSVPGADIERIPGRGSLIVVANHPFGIVDGLALMQVLLSARPDVKMLTNLLLSQVPRLSEHCIFVDPFGSSDSVHASGRGLREAIDWLRSGGALAVFPAGEVSHFSFMRPQVKDPAWSDTVARLAGKLHADVLPVYFSGRNSATFQALGLAHPRLRTLRLTHELFNAQGNTIDIRIGTRITFEEINRFADDGDATRYLRWRTYFLRQRGRTGAPSSLIGHLGHGSRIRREPPVAPIAPPISSDRILAELDSLPPGSLLCQSGEFEVHVATAAQVPSLLHEIGRLREVTFRAAGEGSGLSLDLDEYDQYYKHLFVWDTTQRQLVGAYRLGETSEILNSRGVTGLYTSTLFKYHRKFFARLGPALEMGRSFVRQEYQRQYAPLLMLWRGIGAYVAAHPQTPVLFGAVSMSSEYKRASRELLVRFFERQRADAPSGLSSMVTPRSPFRGSLIPDWETRSVLKVLSSVDDLNAPISDIESDAKELPILVKQYLKLGGGILAFNVDRAFSNVLDGLVMVDLRNTKREFLNRYLSQRGAEAFLAYHEALRPEIAVGA